LINDMHLGYETSGIDPQAPDALKALSTDADTFDRLAEKPPDHDDHDGAQ